MSSTFVRRTSGSGSGNSLSNLMQQRNAYAMMQQAQAAQDSVRQANESRYADILGQYQSRFDRNMGYVNSLGASETQAINSRAAQATAQADQGLIDRGLGNTTVRTAAMQGIEGDRSRQLTTLQDLLTKQRIAVDAPMSMDKLNFMERRNDLPPDISQLAQYMQQMGQGIDGGQRDSYQQSFRQPPPQIANLYAAYGAYGGNPLIQPGYGVY